MIRSPETGVDGSRDLHTRTESVRAGGLLAAAAALAGVAYAVATWQQPHRAAIVILLIASSMTGALPLWSAAGLAQRPGLRKPVFLLRSVAMVAMVATLTALDGGIGSPLALLFFVRVVFVGMNHPLRLVVATGLLDVTALVIVGLATGASVTVLPFVATCLAVVALLCAWEATGHERQRAALALVSRADPLTGCLNRRGFEERLAAELDRSRRGGRRAGLVTLDLDDFKLVNDTRGHEAGDDLLCWVVERSGEVLRPMDSLGRLGGDEFAVLVPGAGAAEAREVAERLGNALGERVSVSVGVASFPYDGIDRDALHRHADKDLYAAKHGRAPEQRGPTTRELAWAAALSRAVELRTAETVDHGAAVAGYAVAIAERLGWSGGELALLRMAAMLHDVGKVAVADQILAKEGPLTSDEYEAIKAHPLAGAEIVGQVDGESPVVEWIRHAHEHVDGGGYPSGLCGDEIPMASRILLVAEAFDAMTTRRPYGKPMSRDDALAELWDAAGAQFDPSCVAALEHHLGGAPASSGELVAS
jgi:diguanylate cyclase (GGDEF)-like protein/putative nucleotidyltransferase with HDIG domain